MNTLIENWTRTVERDKFGIEFIDFAKIDVLGLLYWSVFSDDSPAKDKARQLAYFHRAQTAGIAA